MMIEARFVELLRWMQNRGFTPQRMKAGDKFLCPVTQRVVDYQQAKRQDLRSFLWLPTLDGMKRLGIPVLQEQYGLMVVVRGRRFEGAGSGEWEALLSFFNQVRAASVS